MRLPNNEGDDIARGSAGQLDLGSQFAKGLCWQLREPAKRRYGFPSWSWAGWAGRLKHAFAWDYSLEPSEVRVWLQEKSSEWKRLSEEVLASANRPDASAIVYSPLIRIEAPMVEVNVNYIAGGFDEFTNLWYCRIPGPEYLVAVRVAPPLGPTGTCYWPLIPSVQAAEHDDIHKELCEQRLVCIFLSELRGWGLVVKRSGEYAERVGHMRTYPNHFEPEEPTYSGNDVLPLFRVLRPERRSILLG